MYWYYSYWSELINNKGSYLVSSIKLIKLSPMFVIKALSCDKIVYFVIHIFSMNCINSINPILFENSIRNLSTLCIL